MSTIKANAISAVTSNSNITIDGNGTGGVTSGKRVKNAQTGATYTLGGAGVTVNGVSTGTGALDAQYKAVTIIQDADDNWFMFGAHGAVA